MEAIASLRERLDQRPDTRLRRLIMSGDGSYTNREVLKRWPERTTYMGRLRKDAKLTTRCPHPMAQQQRAAPAAMAPWRPRRSRF